MALYLLAVTPLTLYFACALRRGKSRLVPFDLWRLFVLGGLLGVPGYVVVGIVADLFGYSYRPAALLVRLTIRWYLLPGAAAIAAALVVRVATERLAWQSGGTGSDTLAGLSAMGGFISVVEAFEYFSGVLSPTVEYLLILPTLRASMLIAFCFAWMVRERPLLSVSIALASVLFPGLVAYLYTAGWVVAAVFLAGGVAVAGASALQRLRGNL